MKEIIYENFEGTIEMTVTFQTTRYVDEEEYWAEGMTPAEILDDLLNEGFHQFEKDYMTTSYPEIKVISAKKIGEKKK